MTINVNNIDDFTTMISTCIANNIKDIRVFISENDVYPNLTTLDSRRDYTNFTYVLFTPLYTAIYSNKIKSADYDDVRKTLLSYQNDCNMEFRIQVFESISYNKDNNTINVSKELQVI